MSWRKMKLVVLTLSIAIISMVVAEDHPKCTCQEGFYAKEDNSGSARCITFDKKYTLPCNTPPCVCSGNLAEVRVSDEGLACSEFHFGAELKKWPCENKDDWLLFETSKYPIKKNL
ncbi:uncharacterized protein LOC114326046 isoform X2 [Diabrotica virgifera virgifera]|uniref:Uncharacterized protein LOC114326046 isoform X3 n=1 Tax=Diabrotica virgifera virgifera TaxID=50390 RepID=A0A6P7F993_DIAVI|nr:uncharacterized protein LOC114326046 isoform X2 [Diabrotica virgifera virgifera]